LINALILLVCIVSHINKCDTVVFSFRNKCVLLIVIEVAVNLYALIKQDVF